MSKSRMARLCALALCVLLALGACLPARAQAEEETGRDKYDLAIEVSLAEQLVRVTETLEYTNRTGAELNGMMFCVYANTLRRQTSVPVEADLFSCAFPEGYAPGGVDFMSVQVNGEAAEWGVQGSSESFLRVECHLEPGETALFRFDFYVLLPVYSGAMGIGDLTWRLTNFYPVAAVWDEYLQDFPLNGYTAMTEPLFSDAADYHATISLPETYHLAAPGDVRATTDQSGMVHYDIQAEGVRELALIFSRKTTDRTETLDSGVTVRALGNTRQNAEKMKSLAADALSWMEHVLGAYPWPTLTLIETEYLYEGASYPGVIQVSSDALKGDADALHDLIYNLVAHQYFSGIVGNSRGSAAWLSETLSSYMALLSYMDRDGNNERYLKRFNRQILPSLQITIPGGVTPDSSTERFTSRMEFELVVIDRGCVVLHDIQSSMGYEKFLSALKLYVERMHFKNATAADLLEILNEVSGRRWDEFLYGQMHNMNDFLTEKIEWYE